MYSMRTTRPDWIRSALAEGDAYLRETFEAATGLPLSDQQWAQASVALNRGGMGYRSAAAHSPAAYLASRMATRDLCQQLDPLHIWADDPGGGGAEGWLQQSLSAYNAHVAPGHMLSLERCLSATHPLSQKELSAQLDAFLADSLVEASPTVDKARLLSVAVTHASGWLQAQPSEALGQRWTHAEFVAGVQVWLGATVQSRDGWCPLCDQVMDARGNHSVACMAGGHAITCHDALRDYVYREALAAGLNPEREEEGLLPDDPRRRPGDL